MPALVRVGMQRRRWNTRLTAAALALAAAAPAFARDTVHATQRIDEGDTILRERLRLAPAKSDAAPTFGRRGSVAGRVALKPIGEGEEIHRDAVGDVPSRQFRIEAATPVRIVFYRREGAVLPNAPQRLHTCTLDTASLPDGDAAALRAQLRQSHLLFAPESGFEQLTGSPDDTRVRITIGTTTKTVYWSGEYAPVSVRPLVRRLQACEIPG